MSIELVMPSNHLILCRPFLLLPSIFPNIRVFTNESSNQVVKVSELQLQHHPSNEYSGLISFRIDWFDLLAVQGTQWSSPAPQFESISSPGEDYNKHLISGRSGAVGSHLGMFLPHPAQDTQQYTVLT